MEKAKKEDTIQFIDQWFEGLKRDTVDLVKKEQPHCIDVEFRPKNQRSCQLKISIYDDGSLGIFVGSHGNFHNVDNPDIYLTIPELRDVCESERVGRVIESIRTSKGGIVETVVSTLTLASGEKWTSRHGSPLVRYFKWGVDSVLHYEPWDPYE